VQAPAFYSAHWGLSNGKTYGLLLPLAVSATVVGSHRVAV